MYIGCLILLITATFLFIIFAFVGSIITISLIFETLPIIIIIFILHFIFIKNKSKK
ncbi:hypothetical protein K8M07_03105 [Schnuerera sp. xch1]|uniref:hypothetical protein n=1 Tax=Schnuerera sp. xch1 TaxID=2874283 RepID=UPI001CC07865|nr:hypothetical protein [Schnuerera sp. xch1]MBZ2174230.1 hypothetical protein [Schnuerera sp. xch1]